MRLTRNTRILIYGANIWYFGEGMLGPLLAVFTGRIGGDVLDVTGAWALYLIIMGLCYIYFGKLADSHYNKERMMILGYGLNALFTFGYLLISKPWHLFLIQSGLGMASALATPTWFALFAKSGKKDTGGFHWGLAGGITQIVTGIAIVMGGLIVNYFSFTVLFMTMGIIQVIATIYQAQILKKSSAARGSILRTLFP